VLQSKVSGKKSYAYSRAILEHVMLNRPECQKEFASNNQVFTSAVSKTAYVMFCNGPVNTVEELNGKGLRISGAS
jgi:hypothetical protein|tara:strand:- start:1287 stop:1511 length:225 start_codon:yes stop_codon:yes gene_type:complete